MTLEADTTGAAGFATIDAPALVMGGTASPIAEQRVVQRLGEALPHGTWRRFEGVGHMAPITHHAMIDAAIIEHVLRVG